jgi:hypothetical protein
MNDLIFRIALASLVLVYTVVRLYCAPVTMESGKKFLRARNDVRQIAFGILF